MYVECNWLIGVTMAFRFLSKNEVVRKYLRCVNWKASPRYIKLLLTSLETFPVRIYDVAMPYQWNYFVSEIR